MRRAIGSTRFAMLLVLAALASFASSPTLAQQSAAPPSSLPGRERLTLPVYRVAQAPPVRQAAAAVREHPLDPVLRMARERLNGIDDNVKDYTCTLVKRERINGRLLDREHLSCKIRHKPFSVYMKFLAPKKLRGREVIYVEGKNDGKLLGHGVTAIERAVGIMRLKPTSPLAMRNNRYPITEAGMRNLVFRLIEVGQEDRKFGECNVKFYNQAKIDKTVCTCLEVVHPVPRKNFRFHMARIYIEDKRKIPIRFESYTWPSKTGGRPVLLEEYTYVNVKLNAGLTDADFDERNPNYKFH